MEYADDEPPDFEDPDYRYDIGNWEGDVLVLLPGQYRARSIVGADRDVDQDLLIVGVGTVVLYVDEWSNDVTSPILGVTTPARICIINCCLEVRCETRCPCIEIVDGGAVRLYGCIVRPRPKHECEHRGEVSCNFEKGGAETVELIAVGHRCVLLAEHTTFGPSTRSAIALEGQVAVTLKHCQFRETGRGDKVQRINYELDSGPSVPEGRYPAIAVSYAAKLGIEDCVFVGNVGHPLQWASLHAQTGTVGGGPIAESPEEHTTRVLDLQGASIAGTEPTLLAGIYGFDPSTPEGSERLRKMVLDEFVERQAADASKLLAGSVETVRCRCLKNATSRHLDPVPDTSGETVAVQPWFAEDSPIGKFAEDGIGAPAAYRDESTAATAPLRKVYERFMAEQTKCWLASRRTDTGEMASAEDNEATMSPPFDVFVKLSEPDIVELLQKYVVFMMQFKSMKKLFDHEWRVNELRVEDEPDVQRMPGDFSAFQKKHLVQKAAWKGLSDSRRGELRAKIAEAYVRAGPSLREIYTDLAESDEAVARQLCWAAILQLSPAASMLTTAILGAVALGTVEGLTGLCCRALVWRLQCDDHPGENTECVDTCLCDTDQFRAVELAIEILGQDHPDIIAALFGLLGDTNSSHHGRGSAADLLIRLAERRPELRAPTIDAIAACLVEDEAYLSKVARTILLSRLGDMQARECQAAVRKAFKRELIEQEVKEGYVYYLMKVGLPVDVDDKVVKEEMENPVMWHFEDDDGEFLKAQAQTIKVLAKTVREHNATFGVEGGGGRAAAVSSAATRGGAAATTRGGAATVTSATTRSCAHCGATQAPGAPRFPKCAGCQAVHYCGGTCQKAAWKIHKQACKARKAGATLPLVDQWLAKSPPYWLMEDGGGDADARRSMKKMGVDARMLEGLTIGDWAGVARRMMDSVNEVRTRNDPPLQVGDHVEIFPGNAMTWPLQRETGTLLMENPDGEGWRVDTAGGVRDFVDTRNIKRL